MAKAAAQVPQRVIVLTEAFLLSGHRALFEKLGRGKGCAGGGRVRGRLVWASGGACEGPGAGGGASRERGLAEGFGAIVGPGQPLSAGRLSRGRRLVSSDAWAG